MGYRMIGEFSYYAGRRRLMNGENTKEALYSKKSFLQDGTIDGGAVSQLRQELERLCRENEVLSIEYDKLRQIQKKHASDLVETKKSLKSQIARHKASEKNFNSEKKTLEQKLYVQNQELRTANEKLSREIAERTSMENALRSSETRYKGLFNEVPVGLFQILRDGKIIEVNNTTAKLFGIENKNDLYGTNFYTLFKQPDLIQSAFSTIYCGNILGLEAEAVTQDSGSHIWLRIDAKTAEQSRARAIIIEGSILNITEQKNAQNRLEKSESALSRSQEIARIGNWETDIRTGRITWSDEMYRIFGYTPGSIRNVEFETFLSHIHPEDREKFLSIRGEASIHGKFSTEFRIISLQGEVKYISAHAEFLYDEAGAPLKLFGTNQDISAFKGNEEKLRIILQATSDGTWEWDLFCDSVTFDKKISEEFATTADLPSGKICGRCFRKLIHLEDLPRFEKDLNEHLSNKKDAIDCTCRLELNGAYHWFLIRAMAVRDIFTGKAVKIVGSFENISETARIDELKKQYEFQQKLMDTIPFPIFYKNAHGIYLGSNKAMHAYFDINSGSMIGVNIESIFKPVNEPTLKKVKQTDDLLLSQGGKVTIEVNDIINKIHGDNGDFLIHKAALPGNCGNDVRIVGAVIDITELKRTQHDLDDARIKLNTILNSMREIIIRYDKDMKVLWANKRAEELFGLPQNEIIGRQCHRLWFNADSPCKGCVEKQGGRTCRNEGINIMPDGRIFETVNYKLGGKTDSKPGLVQVAQDVTERELARQKAKQQEEQLIQADKLKALGVLVSGVAHEINNPNNYIMINSSLLKRISDDLIPLFEHHFTSPHDISAGGFSIPQLQNHLPEMIKGISEGAERIREIVLSLKDYSSHVMTDMYSEFDLNFALKRSLVLLENLIRRSTSNFSVEYGTDLPQLKGDIYKIEQVILNIVQNACDALDSKEKAVSIRTFRSGNNAILEVRDEGVGIPSENLKFIRDPFFTTKREQGGTGLGLSISSNIVQEHAGELSISSSPGKGTFVKIKLPGQSDA